MNSEIHKRKIALLSRLLEEKAVTLEDCLLLLNEEEQIQPLDPNRLYGPTQLRPMTPWPKPHPGPAPYVGQPWNQYVGDILNQQSPLYINTTGTGTTTPALLNTTNNINGLSL